MAETTTTLNNLPDDILIYILSFLNTLTAVHTSLISRRWRNLWISVSRLSFDINLFPPSICIYTNMRRFANFVNQTLLLRQPDSPIIGFRLCLIFYGDQNYNQVDSWIQYAINHKTAILDIKFFYDESQWDMDDTPFYYDFPFDLLKYYCSSIIALRLCYADLILPHNISLFKFPSILHISLCGINLEDETAFGLVLACVNLETLYLEDCLGVHNFRIYSSTLKNLVINRLYTRNAKEGESCEICAPNLRSISIWRYNSRTYSIKDSSSLEEAEVDFPHALVFYEYWREIVRLLTGVKRLHVQNWWFKLLGHMDVSLESYALKNLKHLALSTGYTKYDLLGIVKLLNIAPKINTLVLDYLPKIDDDEKLSVEVSSRHIYLNIRNLKHVKMEGYTGSDNELQFLILLGKQGVVLEEIVVANPPFPPIVFTRPFQPVKFTEKLSQVSVV